MQVFAKYFSRDMLLLTPNIIEFRTKFLNVEAGLPHLLHCAPHLCQIEVQTLQCSVIEYAAPHSLHVLCSLPQSITWGPLELRLLQLEVQSTVQELYADLAGSPLPLAVSKLTLDEWQVDPPIAVLRALFPNVLHIEHICCHEGIASLSEAIAAWPMLRSISLWSDAHIVLAAQQHLEAAARTAAELKLEVCLCLEAGQTFEIKILCFIEKDETEEEENETEESVGRLDVCVAAIRSAGRGRVAVHWSELRVAGAQPY